MRAALIIGVLWALWHLPAFFYRDNLLNLGAGGLVGLTLGVITGSVLLTWLYNRTGASILAVALWHGVFDFITVSPAAEGPITAIMSALVMVWAGGIVIGALRRPRPGAANSRSLLLGKETQP